MKFRVVAMLVDGVPDSQGQKFLPTDIEFQKHEVPVLLEFVYDMQHIIGKATLTLEGSVVWADLEILDSRLPPPAEQILYPCLGGSSGTDKKFLVDSVGLTVNSNVDPRILTIGQQVKNKKEKKR